MTGAPSQVASQFFAAARALALHTGSLQERLADAYADHLLAVTMGDLPVDLQPALRELEERLNRPDILAPEDDDPFQAAARELTDAEVVALIDAIVLVYGRLAAAATPG
ncbi:MAG: hypothetical protein M3336_16550 [Chloroflexota bacterium]|nr:hypothetical protein [Chloroflexota bacterium]